MALSIVYPAKGSTVVPTVDIVAVHGLGGNARDTWTHPKSNAFWLQDFLPQQIPDARILTFGYNAAAAFNQTTAQIVDHAKSLLGCLVDKREENEERNRPLIFIAHSLGGIVVKQALLSAVLEPRYRSIYDATRGLVFFGTPHRGSDKAVYGKMLADIAQNMMHRPDAGLLSALKTNSDVLLRLASDFRHQLSRYEVVSFFELKPMGLFKHLIVEKYSALLEVEHEDQQPVDANHSTMCKFEQAEDDTYEKVWKRINRIRKSVRQDSELFNKHFIVPHPLSSLFTGRDEVCQLLDKSLALSPVPRQPQQRRFVLYGLGGSGKTQICLNYAQKHQERYWGVFWIDSSTQASIRQSMIQIALRLQVDQDIDSVKQFLANTPQPWLLVFDNADDPDLRLTSYFPTGNRGDIIITSRDPGCRHYNSAGCKEIGKMKLEDAMNLLSKTVYGESTEGRIAEEECQTVVSTLGCLALAVAHAGAYIRETPCSFTDYIELYQRRREELWSYFPKYGDTDYRYTVYTTWQVSLDRIEAMHDARSQQALNLLKLVSFYHHEQIPLDMFTEASQRWPKDDDDNDNLTWLPWPREVTELFDVRQILQALVTLLASYSLVTRNADNSLSLHPLMYEWYRYQLSHAEQLVGCRHAAYLLARSVNWEYSNADYTFRRLLVPHVLACLRSDIEIARVEGQASYDHEQFDDKDELDIYCSSVQSFILGENGFTRDAIRLQEKVLHFRKSKLGEDHPDTLSSMSNLATHYSGAGRRAEALVLSEQVVQLQKSKLGEHHPDTLSSMNNLANRYSEAGRRDEALALSEQVVQLRKSKLGEHHPDTLNSMNNLAIYYSEAGRRAEALVLSEQVVQLQKSKLGEHHPDTLGSMNNLGNRYSEAGRRDEALALLKRVVQLRKSKLGEYHPDTLGSMNNLANRYREAERRDEALALLEQVVQLQKSKLGEHHPDTLNSMNNLAIYYSEAGRRDEALVLSEQVVQLQKSKLGEHHPGTLNSMNNLATYYSEAGRRAEALVLSEQVVQLQKSKLGEHHPDTLGSMYNLANRYSEAGRRDEALALLEQVVQLQKSKLGEDHLDTLNSMNNLATYYSEAGRRDEALVLLEQVVQLRKSMLGEDDPDTLILMYNLAIDYSYAGRGDMAFRLSEQVVRLQKTKLGANHPDTLDSIQLHASLTRMMEEGQVTKTDSRRGGKLSKLWRRLR